MIDLGECQSLDSNNLPSEIYPPSLQTPPSTNDRYFEFVNFGVSSYVWLFLPLTQVTHMEGSCVIVESPYGYVEGKSVYLRKQEGVKVLIIFTYNKQSRIVFNTMLRKIYVYIKFDGEL